MQRTLVLLRGEEEDPGWNSLILLQAVFTGNWRSLHRLLLHLLVLGCYFISGITSSLHIYRDLDSSSCAACPLH